jgi:hypothetical protein
VEWIYEDLERWIDQYKVWKRNTSRNLSTDDEEEDEKGDM